MSDQRFIIVEDYVPAVFALFRILDTHTNKLVRSGRDRGVVERVREHLEDDPHMIDFPWKDPT